MLIENSTNELIFASKNDNSCGGRASELVSDKFICTYLGKVNHISLIYRVKKNGKQLSHQNVSFEI